MKRSSSDLWEYETLRPPREATKKELTDSKVQLNELGAEGWELVTTLEYAGGGTKYLVFKRPVDTDNRSDGANVAEGVDTSPATRRTRRERER